MIAMGLKIKGEYLYYLDTYNISHECGFIPGIRK